MITFWIFAVAMVIVALIFLLRPFFLDMKQDEIARSALNVKITKERISELKIELEQGTISQSEYDQTLEELEQALLYDVDEETISTKKINNESYNRFTRIALIFSVPVFAISIYGFLGQPDLIEGAKKQTATVPAGHAPSNKAGASLGTVEQMVEKLAAKLKENPDNAEGWFMLARSYMSMNRYPEAVVALEKTNKLIPNNPVVMLRYADALTMANGGRISGKPFELIKQAVALKPDDPTGLWLIGMGYEEQGNYSKAISYWNLLLPLLQDEKSKNQVQNLIRQAKSKAGISTQEIVSAEPVKQPVSASLKVNVTMDRKLLSQASPSDTVFVFAKAVSGPPMPLAVVRKQVKDLPIGVTLDDSMAMIPTMKLSNFKNVEVVARISKSGSPKAQSGDLQSTAQVVSVEQKQQINLTINKVVP